MNAPTQTATRGHHLRIRIPLLRTWSHHDDAMAAIRPS
jgi:hypothetical protein